MTRTVPRVTTVAVSALAMLRKGVEIRNALHWTSLFFNQLACGDRHGALRCSLDHRDGATSHGDPADARDPGEDAAHAALGERATVRHALAERRLCGSLVYMRLFFRLRLVDELCAPAPQPGPCPVGLVDEVALLDGARRRSEEVRGGVVARMAAHDVAALLLRHGHHGIFGVPNARAFLPFLRINPRQRAPPPLHRCRRAEPPSRVSFGRRLSSPAQTARDKDKEPRPMIAIAVEICSPST